MTHLHTIQTKLPIFTAKTSVKPISYTLTLKGKEVVTGSIDTVLNECYNLKEQTEHLDIKPNFS